MAQIIRHRKGVLESVASATKRKAELLVVTGSSESAIDQGLLFVGVDGSTATPSNKILTGTTTPNLTGANYDTSIDGIPFYNTSENKYYILKKGGNVEVQATANTGGSGIVSSSAQIDSLGFLQVGGDSVVSSSAQITIGSTDGFSSFSSSLNTTNIEQNNRLSLIETFTASIDGDFVNNSELASATGALETTISNLDTGDISEGSNLYYTDSRVDARISNADTDDIDEGSSNLYYTDARVKTKLDAEGVISGSSQVDLENVIGDTDDLSEGSSNLYFTDARVKTKLDTETVISGSSQVIIDDVSGFSTYSSSVDTRVSSLESAVGEGSNIDGRLSSLESFSGSAESDLTELFATASNHETRVDDLETFQSDIETALTVSDSDVTVNGNFTVSGTQTIVDSNTVQIGDNIIELNGSGATNGGLWVKDATAPNTATGSLVWDSTNDYWKAGVKGSEIKILLANGDSVVSGSSQIDLENVQGDTDDVTEGSSNLYFTDARVKTKLTAEGVISGSTQINISHLDTDDLSEGSSNLYFTDARVKTKLDVEGVISGSSQVTIGDTTGFNTYSSSVATAINNAVAGAEWDNLNGKPAGIVSGSSQVVSYLDDEDVNLGGISGSSLDITGNTRIDGNLVLGGNITIGDASSDTISFGGDVSSDIIPSTNNSFDLGSSSDKFAEVHATNLYGNVNGAINATNNVVSASQDTSNIDITISSGVISANLKGGVHSGSAQVVSSLLNQATDFGTGRVSGDDFGNSDGSSTITGSFVGDGSGITGLSTTITVSGSDGSNDQVSLLNGALSFDGGTGVSATVATDTVTISVQDGSTSQKGIASFASANFAVSSGNVTIKDEGVTASKLNDDVAGDGISLDSSDNSISVDYGSTANTAVQGNISLTVQGTSNEIEISGGSVTLGAGGTVTIGLPDDVVIGNDLDVTNDLSVGGDAVITGNLSVLGTTTTIDSTTVQIGDNIIELNIGGAQSTAGLQVTDSTGDNTVSGSLLWNGTNDVWTGGALGSEKEFARLNTAPTANKVLKSDSNGLLVDSVLSDDGTDATFSGDVIVDGLTASSFLYADANKQLTAIAPSNAGDVIQWNGSSFVASNELDGGTF